MNLKLELAVRVRGILISFSFHSLLLSSCKPMGTYYSGVAIKFDNSYTSPNHFSIRHR